MRKTELGRQLRTWPGADLALRSSYEAALIEGLPAEKVKAGDESDIPQMRNIQLYAWMKTENVPPGRPDGLDWARRMKGSEVSSEAFFAAPVAVRGLLLYAAWNDFRVEIGDLVDTRVLNHEQV